MYFNEKENTNIDDQFKKSKTKLNINPKVLGFIIGGIVLVGLIILIIVLIVNNINKAKIELFGDTDITILLNSEYIEPGYKAVDKNNNDITDLVVVTSSVDTSEIGEYEVLYSVNGKNKVRYVKVVDGDNDTIMSLNGKLSMTLYVGDNYIEPGYIVYDSMDTNLSEKVEITGSVDTSKEGVYQLTYSVTNSRNITISKKRTIIVTSK